MIGFAAVAQGMSNHMDDSEQKYRLLADNTLDVIWKMDLDLKFTYVNPAIIDMLGFTTEEWIGSKLPEHCPPEDMQEMQKLMTKEIASQEKHRWVVFESGFIHKNGTEIPCEVSARILFDEDGMPTSMQGTTRDVTERKIARAKLNKTLSDLKRSNTDLEQFAYVASHDLQEPLRMINGYLDLIKRKYKGKLDSDMDNYIELVVSGAYRMQLLIDDLLKYSRVGNHANPLIPTECENILDQSLSNLKTSIDDSGAVVTHDPLPTLIADGSQLVHVFQNLISNAIKFKDGKPPRIHISAKKDGSEWLFSVADNGIGIEPEFFDRIFVIFQRLHGKSEYSGTGIGLAICKKIVRQHGGRIWVESEIGEGSTFYFTIQGIHR